MKPSDVNKTASAAHQASLDEARRIILVGQLLAAVLTNEEKHRLQPERGETIAKA